MQGMPINITKECSDAEIFECDIATQLFCIISCFIMSAKSTYVLLRFKYKMLLASPDGIQS